MGTDLSALLESRPRRGRGAIYPPEVAAARKAERNRRTMEAKRRAYIGLAALHPRQFDDLMRQAKDMVAAENGPLPGDA